MSAAPQAEHPPSFRGLGLSADAVRQAQRAGFREPTPIQSAAVPRILAGHDVVGCAQTGTGKTAAFVLPLIDRLRAHEAARAPSAPRALILAPTRELAQQIGEVCQQLAEPLGLRTCVVTGGVPIAPQRDRLEQGVDILVATPGRLLDLLGLAREDLADGPSPEGQPPLDPAAPRPAPLDLSHVALFVLDEADRLLDMGFLPDVETIVSRLPRTRQSLLFSATFSPDVRALIPRCTAQAQFVDVTPQQRTLDSIVEELHLVADREKPELLRRLIESLEIRRGLVFTATRHGTDAVMRALMRAGIPAEAIHSEKPQPVRDRAVRNFESGRAWILVGTDVAARGLDIAGVTHVVNFDLPQEAEMYLHRIGRTGRAGASGRAISFCSPAEAKRLEAIERLLQRTIPRAEPARGSDPDAAAR